MEGVHYEGLFASLLSGSVKQYLVQVKAGEM